MLFSHRKNQKRNRNSSRLAQKKRNLKALESLEGRRLLSADGWVATGFGNGYVQTDSEGSVYLASMVESPDTDNDLVLAKYSADGTREWTREFVVAGRDNVSNLAIDESGQSLYIVGSYFDVNPFKPDVFSVGNLDLFVAKLSTVDGSVQWHRSWGTPAHEFANGIAVSNGSVYVAGRVGPDPDGIDFDGTIVVGQNRDDSPAFILKIDAESINGQVVWAKQSNGSANPVDIAVTHSASNETLVTIGGIVANDVDFDAVGLSTSERSHFVAQLIDDGFDASFTWARSWRTDLDFHAIESDEAGIYATGDFRLPNGEQVDFGSGFLFESRGSSDAYLLRLDHDDGSTAWAKQIGGALQDVIYDVTTDGADNQLIVTGAFQETAEFGSGIALTSHGSVDGFSAAYNMSDGSLRNLRRIGGASADYLAGLSYHAGWVYAAGRSDSPYAEFPFSTIGNSDDAFVDFRAEPSGRFLTKFRLDGPQLMEIAEPVYGSSVNGDASITFSAVTDAATVSWTSSIDGYLGEGTNITSTLSPGLQFITAKATNAEGQSVLAGTLLYVTPSDLPLDVPKPVQDAKGKGASVTRSTLTITDSKTIQDLNVHLDIQHTSTPDLDVALISPSGTRIELFSDLGSTADADFSMVYLDDEAELSIGSVSAPFSGIFQPEKPGALSAFDGEDALGTWTLEIIDDTRNNTGTLNDWWLVIDSEVTPGITVAPTAGLETSEAGGTASFNVVLDSQPSADVTIAVSSSNTAEGTVNLSSLTFTPANWNQPQTIVVTGVDDTLEDGDMAYSIITGAALSTDPDYDGLDPADVAIINLDDDTNYAPVAVDDDVTADQDMAAVIDALANDSDPEGAALTIVSVGQPTSGSVVLNADQTLTYTPNTGFSGTDSFTYQISDGDKTDQATVTITVRDNTIAPMFVGQIFLESRKGGRYRAVFVVHDEFNQPLEGVQIQVSFAGQTYSGVTDSQGEFKTDWNKLNAGDSYFADVLDLALAGFDWNDLEDDDEVWLTA